MKDKVERQNKKENDEIKCERKKRKMKDKVERQKIKEMKQLDVVVSPPAYFWNPHLTMNFFLVIFFLVNYYLVTFGIATDRQTDRRTD